MADFAAGSAFLAAPRVQYDRGRQEENNAATIFVPGEYTWHGFRKRPIDGVRRSRIDRYVASEWRNRHELACPDGSVG